MKNYDYGYGFKPISSWGYVGYSSLWSIPVIGWIFWLCSAIGGKNRNVRNYARSYICKVIVVLAISVIAAGVAFLLNWLDVFKFDTVIKFFEDLLKIDIPF